MLDHLDKDVLPREVIQAFVTWCLWEQARPALVQVLEQTPLAELAAQFKTAQDLPTLAALAADVRFSREETSSSDRPLAISAAEGAAFEFANLIQTAQDSEIDAESAAFFASRVCGWAGWASHNFRSQVDKTAAEQSARQAQEARLEALYKQFTASQP